VVWFTGLSGAGKTTLAGLVSAELIRRGRWVEVLDGDLVREQLAKPLGYSQRDRDENVRNVGKLARQVVDRGGCAVTATISPYRAVRAEVRGAFERFCEVFCDSSLDALIARDPKGLYRKALRGEIANFTGISDPYEVPESPELHLHTDRESPEESAARIIERLVALGYLSA
jgi:sulfate adenylyltransferase/3'-phosphoadenosine 5'-phosphosulfate synthase